MQIFCLFCKKKPTFSILPSTFTKHPYQFIYSTHLFNKIFILFTFFIISFSLEQTHKLIFSVEPHPHPSFNKITHTQLATVFSVKVQTQHKPKITHTQPPTTSHYQQSNRTNRRNHRRSLSQGFGSLDHGSSRKPVIFM